MVGLLARPWDKNRILLREGRCKQCAIQQEASIQSPTQKASMQNSKHLCCVAQSVLLSGMCLLVQCSLMASQSIAVLRTRHCSYASLIPAADQALRHELVTNWSVLCMMYCHPGRRLCHLLKIAQTSPKEVACPKFGICVEAVIASQSLGIW